MGYPSITHIKKSVDEARDSKTIYFDFEKKPSPGQFFMIWIPGVDEIPMSCSSVNGNNMGITFRRLGDATNKLYDLKAGDKIGVRGPYGNGFTLSGERILLVGGGTGVATLLLASKKGLSEKKKLSIIVGAKTKSELLFIDTFNRMGFEDFMIATDDGSIGYHGLASNLANEVIEKQDFDLVLTCGPELMMKKIVDFCLDKKIPVQASLERYIKCGIGICGQCCIGEGLRVCKDGPVFDGETLKNISDFGIYKRDASGRKIDFCETKK